MLLSFSMFIQALPIKYIRESALRSRENVKLGTGPLRISALTSSKRSVRTLDPLPSLNIIQDGQRFNKCTLQNESVLIPPSHPPSLRSVMTKANKRSARGSTVGVSAGR